MDKIVFHIGHHKTGTSWLQDIYFQNTDVFNLLNDYKEPWNDDLCRLIIETNNFFETDYCRSLLLKRIKKNRINILSAERLSGHPISGGFDAAEIAIRLKKICPDAKVIITKREPKKLISSVYKQMISEGYCGTLDDFLFFPHWKSCGINKNYFLQKKIVKNYQDYFGKKNVLILEFEKFLTDQSKFLSQIQDFLEIKNFQVDKRTFSLKVNKTPKESRIRAQRFLNKFRKTELNPFPLFSFSNKLQLILTLILSIFFKKNGLIDESKIELFLKNT